MRSLRSLSLLLLSSLAYTSPLPDAGAETNALVDRSAHPRLFTVQSFQLAQPSGSGLTGYYLTTSKNGGLILQNTAPNPATVLYVDTDAKAFLATRPPTPIYIDTISGALSSARDVPDSALTVPFFHLGSGTDLYVLRNGFAVEGSAKFQWIGSDNSAWFACPLQGADAGKYALIKQMTSTNPDVGNCTTVTLGALDYKG